VALALPRRVDPAASLPGSRPSVFREAAAGERWLAGHRVVGSLALIGGLASVGYMLPFSVLVLFAGERLGLDAAGYGVLLAASALGGLAGSAIAA
ncbi:MFS transporter, partial [Clavibacter michiganensis]